MWIIRVISIIFFVVMSMDKINIVSLEFINDEVLHYLFNGSILFLTFTFLLPLSTKIKLLTWSAKSSKSIKDFIPDSNLNIDIYIANGIFSNNAVTLYGWKEPLIILGEKTLKNLEENELNFVLQHEIYHIKEKHLLKSFISVMFTLVSIPIFILYISTLIFDFSIILSLLLSIAIYIVGLLLHFNLLQKFEMKADRYAAKIIGKESSVNTLKRLKDMNNIKERKISLLESHPSVQKRIENINNI